MKYRPEIDGLRTLAVLPVILFHAGFDVFSGGYVGVDVFFVISGFLITTILIGELDRGNFSIIAFYERRARRILPALFFILAACLPFAYLWMLPSQLEDFAKSLVAVVLFVSNIFFWQGESYFAASTDLKPLLHTWSLAVEEQYYVFFPVMLAATWRFGRSRVFWGIVIVAILSLFLSEWGWRHKPTANFYLLPTRAWELLAGSICAFVTARQPQRANNLLSGLGVLLIVIAIFLFDETTPFPSVYALVPVGGAVMIVLFARQGTLAYRLLSSAPFVGIGVISYSAYLWHQPLFAFARLRSLTAPPLWLMGTLTVTTLLLAWLTWRWIEQPFRRGGASPIVSRPAIFWMSGVFGAAFSAIGMIGLTSNGLDWRFGDDLLRFVAAESDRAVSDDKCLSRSGGILPVHPVEECNFGGDGREVEVLLMGDSHAMAISDMLGPAVFDAGYGYYDMSYAGCVPIRGLRRFDVQTSANHQCDAFNAGVFEYASDAEIKVVVLTARFARSLIGPGFDNEEGGIEPGVPAWVDLASRASSNVDDPERIARILAQYEAEINKLAQSFKVVLVYPIPEAGWNVPIQGFKNALFNQGEPTLTTPLDAYERRTTDTNALFDRLVLNHPNIFGARVQDVLCDHATGRRVNADANGVYYFDDNHLSNAGARLIAPVIVKAIDEAMGKNRLSTN